MIQHKEKMIRILLFLSTTQALRFTRIFHIFFLFFFYRPHTRSYFILISVLFTWHLLAPHENPSVWLPLFSVSAYFSRQKDLFCYYFLTQSAGLEDRKTTNTVRILIHAEKLRIDFLPMLSAETLEPRIYFPFSKTPKKGQNLVRWANWDTL